MMTVKKTVIVLLAYLFLLSAAIAVEEQEAQPPPQVQDENCIPLERYDQCVTDYWQQHDARQALEQQLQEVQEQVASKAQLEGDLRGQIEECQGQVAQLQGQSENLESQMATLRAEAEQLTSQLQERAVALDEAHNRAHASRRELEQAQRDLESLQKGRTIVTVDVDLLRERLGGLQGTMMEHGHDFFEVCQGYWQVVKAKLADGWKYLETKVWPDIKDFFEQKVFPVCQHVYLDGLKMSKKAYRTTHKFMKDTYAPYREPVHQKLDQARIVWKENYQKHVEPKVKEYKLDQYAAQGKTQFLQYKDQAMVYVDQGHDQLVETIRRGSIDALKYAKANDGMDRFVPHLEVMRDRRHDMARYVEYGLGFLVLYVLYRLFFGGKKKKPKHGKQKRSKAEWEKEQQMKNGNGKKTVTVKSSKTKIPTPKGGGGGKKK